MPERSVVTHSRCVDQPAEEPWRNGQLGVGAAPLEVLYPQTWRWPGGPAIGSALNRHVASWLVQKDLLSADAAHKLVDTLNLDAFVAMAFPGCESDFMRGWIARYTAWLYLADDHVEQAVARDGGLQEVASYLTALERRTERLATHPLAMVLADLSCELLSSVPDTSFARRWRQAHHRYWLLGVLEEGRPATQALQPCLVRKPAVTAVEIYFELAEVATGARLSLEAHDATEMNELRVLGALIDGLFNDALSFERERERRMHSNIVICLCDECAMREEHALRRTIALHNDLVMDFDVLAQALLGGHPAQASELGPYLQAMRHLLVGLAEWQVYSRRYRSCLPVKIVVNGPDVYHPICRAGSFDEATLAEEITRRLKSERAATGAS